MGHLFFGTPGETRTHYLTLRRRTLYPGELRGRVCYSIVPKKIHSVNEKPTHFSHIAAYNGKMILQGGKRMDKKDVYFDVDDYIFADQEWQPSEK